MRFLYRLPLMLPSVGDDERVGVPHAAEKGVDLRVENACFNHEVSGWGAIARRES